MNEKDARVIIEQLVVAIQKYRSNATHELAGELLEISKQVQPYTLGDDYFPILLKMQDGKMDALDFYNVMVIATRAPEMTLVYHYYWQEELPDPDPKWLVGWKATECQAVIHHGPGHQSSTKCQVSGPHQVHEARYGSFDQLARWEGDKIFSGAFDEPPEVMDDD